MLHLLCLLGVQLLCLLLVLLLQLLRFRWRSVLSRQLLMFLVLLLLELLPLLVLLRDYAFLLLLIFLVQLRIPRIGSGGSNGRQLLGMGCEVGAGSRGNWGRAAVRGNPLLRVIVGSPLMLSLSGDRSNMFTARSSLFLRRGALVDPTVAAVEAYAIRRLIHP